MAQSSTPPLTRLTVCGYKSLADEATIELAGLTILAGANSSGKSSMMQPLLLLKQTLEASYDPGPLLLSGPNVRFTSFEQALSRYSAGQCSEELRVSLGLPEETGVTLAFRYVSGQGVVIARAVYADSDGRTELREDLPPQDIRVGGRVRAQVGKLLKDARLSVTRDRCFLDVLMKLDSLDLPTPNAPRVWAEMCIRSLIHLPGLRGNPERTYPVTAVGAAFPGTFEHYTASVISQWQAQGRDELDGLGEDLRRLGLTWKVRANPVNDTQVELEVGRLPRAARGGARDLVSVADVGFGVSQVLPVLVALRAAGKGQVVYLEQPEIHLHPRAQTDLARVMADAVARGVRVVIETHSSLLLLGVQALVGEGVLPANEVKLHWFSRNDRGVTRVDSADLDAAGAYGAWPEDFGDVELRLQDRYLSGAEARLRARS